MIAIVDYGAGNLFSIANALEHLSISYQITQEPQALYESDGVLLPGSALFPMRWQCCGKKTSFRFCGRWQRKSLFLASALGMQVLFCQGEEFCLTKGLGLLKGQVKKMNPPGLKIPHMGWNRLEIVRDCPLTRGLPEQAYVYFVHSYQAVPQEKDLVAWAEYGGPVPALVWDGAYCYGAQFHPEKSGETGLRILQNFADLCRNTVRINP